MSEFVEVLENPDKIINMEASECSPAIKQIEIGICSSNEMIQKFKKWLDIESNNKTPKEIIKEVNSKTGCSSESCSVAKIIPEELDNRFNPLGPWNSTNWLSNTNIDKVFNLYKKKIHGFVPISFQMRDFAKSPNSELANFDFLGAKKSGIKYVACALNTDWSSGSGEHWVSFFVDFPNKTVEYFDSAGQTPHPEFTQLLVDTASKLSFIDDCITTIQHQTQNTECGVYTLFYILSRLHGVPSKKFRGRRIPDDLMVAFRKFLFRHGGGD